MQNDMLRRATGLLTRSRRRIAWKRIVSFLACIVVFCTTYALILPAITMEESIFCGKEPHQHSEKCYEKVLICEQEEGEITSHTHTADCVTTEQKLICNNEESQHRHTDECYETVETYTCGIEEGKSTGHVHTDECYESTLVCEIEEHEHELICYSNPNVNLETPGVWMLSLSGVTLSGNSHTDLIEVAKSQLGYTESSSNYDVAEDGATKKGYNRYGAWYGDPYGDWSAMFVSFCLFYANIPEDCCPQESDSSVLAEKLQSDEYGIYVDAAEGYKPLAGDLIFFDEDGDGSSDHVGLVAEMLKDKKGEFTKIKTIQGDVDDRVKYVTYPTKDETIVGYAKLPNITRDATGENITKTAYGEDYTISVTYGIDANIPDSAYLIATEIKNPDPNYEYRYHQAAELYGWETTGREGVRLFDIGFFLEDTEFVPTAAVDVTITLLNQVESHNYDVLLFGENASAVTAESIFDDRRQDINFTVGHLGDIMTIVAEEAEPPEGTVQGITPNGTVIHLFDYWITKPNDADFGQLNNVTEGINAGHVLKFTGGNGHGPTNDWTGEDKLPNQGLVENTLDKDGFPVLTDAAVSGSCGGNENNGQPESLAYLFNPNIEDSKVGFRKTFRNVGGLFQDINGYYRYDSTKNYAELNEKTNKFTLYSEPRGSHNDNVGQFFPFNSFAEMNETPVTDPKVNHYFGLSMTSRFVQRYGGHTNASRKTSTIFEFSGDDDVWVFIDNVLVGDLGGIHDAADLSIDFATGKIVIKVTAKKDDPDCPTIETTLEQCFKAAGKPPTEGDSGWQKVDGNWIFSDGSYHTLKFFYMERGNWASNMELTYNLSAVPATEIHKVDQYGRRIPNVEFKFYKANEDWSYDSSNAAYTGTTNEEGVMTFVDGDGMPYTIKELRGILGDYCIVKEGDVPAGYRKVVDEIKLCLNDRVLWCENTYESGVWAMVTLNVAAPMQLTLPAVAASPTDLTNPYIVTYYSFDQGEIPSASPGAEPNVNALAEPGETQTDDTGGTPTDDTGGTQTDPPTPGETQDTEPTEEPTLEIPSFVPKDNGWGGFGTLFGVVVRRVGDGDYKKLTSWAPVSGNSKDGYIVHPLVGETDDAKEYSLKESALAIAKEQGSIFTMAASGAMELNLENLPGHVRDYLYMKTTEEERKKAEFTVVYYWTSEVNMDDARPWNTFRVNSNLPSPDAFDRMFGATIEVPNMGNRLIVQKYDIDKSPYANGTYEFVNGAIFGLFRADENGNYIAKDGTKINRYFIESGQYTLDIHFDPNNSFNSYARIIVNENPSLPPETPTPAPTTTPTGEPTPEAPQIVPREGSTEAPTPTGTPPDSRVIEATEVRRTSSLYLENTDGTTAFGIQTKPLVAGCYYLLEVEAPLGYDRNTNPVMVMVTDSAIYTNAGIAPTYDDAGNLIKDDYIRTARGVGYITSTLHKAASAGDIDRTLTWIYHRLAISNKESTSFADAIPFGDGSETWHYLDEKDLRAWYPTNTEIGEGDRVLTSYLVYDRTPQQLGEKRFLANYEPDPTPSPTPGGEVTPTPLITPPSRDDDDYVHPSTTPTRTLPITTEYGWSFNEIYQDYAFGRAYLDIMGMDATYTELQTKNPDGTTTPINLYRLFSRAIYVRVGDKRLNSDLEIRKTVLDANNNPMADNKTAFNFTVVVEGLGEFNKAYNYFIYDAGEGLPDNAEPTGTYSGGNLSVTLMHNQVLVIKDLPGGLHYTVTEEPLTDYTTTNKVDNKDPEVGYSASGTLHCRIYDEKNNRYVSKVAYTNTSNRAIKLTICKKAFGNQNLTLGGAEFVLFMRVRNSTYYYDAKTNLWVIPNEGQKPEDFALTTGLDGIIEFAKIADGEYVLKEIEAPVGYMCLNQEIRITIKDGLITKVNVGGDINSGYVSIEQGNDKDPILTVNNGGGPELPATGGTGIKRYITGGALLCACAGILLLYIKRKRRLEDSIPS